MIDILGSLDQYTGYTLMKHAYEPTTKYRLQIWYMRPGWNVPKSAIAWGKTTEEAYYECLAVIAARDSKHTLEANHA